MKTNNPERSVERRGFLGALATGAAAIGLAAITSPFKLSAQTPKSTPVKKMAGTVHPADLWFNKVKGTHRAIYDATSPHEVFPFAWPRVFLLTNAATGSPESDCGVVVVMRHEAIGYAFKDKMWEKYGFGEFFKANEIGPAFQAADAATATKTRNPFWNPKPGDFKLPGFGPVPIGINELQTSGVLFCVCNAAMTVFSTVLADKMGMKQEEVMNEWMSELIPGIQVVPSGVWAVGRAQEHGCKYIFAG
ncbi:MAG: twin-arginine translocation signal domain-containing protein [Bacteroidota bacterium]